MAIFDFYVSLVHCFVLCVPQTQMWIDDSFTHVYENIGVKRGGLMEG